MAAPKMHYNVNDRAACSRDAAWMNTDTSRVTCASCISRNSFQEDHQKAVPAKEAAFQAQEPKQVAEPWRDGLIQCRECMGDLFRYRGRTCYGHYENHVCANCGHTESRLTETGMSF